VINNAIKGMFASDGKLYMVTDSGLHTFTNNGMEPKDWPQEKFTGPIDGLAEDFRAFYFGEIQELVNGCMIDGQQQEELKEAIHVMVLEGLLPAFEELRSIRLFEGKPIPVLNRKKHYENFARVLWHGYKDLMPKVAGLLGYKIGFLFQNDANFEKGLSEFVAQNSGQLLLDVAPFLKGQRANWQNELSEFRNHFLEHRKKSVATTVDRFYRAEWAESIFDAIWRTIAELLSTFLESRFTPTISIRRTPAERRRPEHPRMWELHFCSPVQRPTFTKIEM
jgi:hypothetical protein